MTVLQNVACMSTEGCGRTTDMAEMLQFIRSSVLPQPSWYCVFQWV